MGTEISEWMTKKVPCHPEKKKQFKKISPETAEEIKKEYADEDVSYRDLAAKYRCSVYLIEQVVAGNYYKNAEK